MNRKLLLFGFDELPTVLAVAAAAGPFGAEAVPVARKDYNCRLEALARGETSGAQPYAGGALGGRMIVLCGLEDQMDGLLPALRSAGAGPDCLKAVLTAHNRNWTPAVLFHELRREQDAIRKQMGR